MVVAIESHKIAYMAVPKSACTSVKVALSQCDPSASLDMETAAADHSVVHSAFPTKRFRPHRWRGYEGWWRITVVRDPIKRLMSVYTDIVAGRQEIRNSRRLRRADSVLPIDPDPDFFYQNLDGYMKAASVVKHHALPVWLFIGPRPHLYDRIYRIEELPILAEDLSNRIGRPITIPRFNKATTTLDFSDLNNTTRASLKEFLDVEYASLAGIYEKPY